MAGKTNASQPGSISIGTYGAGKILFSKYNPTTSTWTTQALLTDNGKFVIGNVDYTASGYGLFVEGGVLTEQVKVAIKSTNDWSDYVFDAKYELMPLKLLEKYIADNKHLPDVPSAEEVVTDGVNIAKMDATLLQKIEELTLYIIEQDKKINALQEKVNNLEVLK